MFKKTLLALAIAGTALNASATLTLDASGAGTGSTNAQLVSAEGGANTAAVTANNVTLTASGTLSNYTSIEKIRITLTGGSLTPATNVGVAYNDTGTVGNSVADLTATATSAVAFPSTNVVEITLAAADATTIGGGIEDTDTFVVSGLNIDPDGSFGTGTAVSYTFEVLSNVGGAVIDTGTGLVLDGVAQFSAATTSANRLNGIVDVGDGRFTFDSNGQNLDGTANDKSDRLAIDVASALVDHLPADASGNPITYVVNGDFGYLDADGDGDADGVTSTTTTPVVSDDFSTVTEVSAAIANSTFDGSGAHTAQEVFAFAVDGETQVIMPQSFTADVSFAYDPAAGSSATFTDTVSGGSFTLNGASAFISFLPFGSDFAQSITITNIGTVDGSITVDLVGNGTSVTETLTATATPRSVTQIGAEIKAIATANGMDDSASVNITVNSPDANIRVDALYFSKSSQDRGVVLTGGNQ